MRYEVFSTSFIKSAIGLTKRLKFEHEDLLPNVEQSEMKAKDPRVIIVLNADCGQRVNLLKAPSTSNFIKRIRVSGFSKQSATRKCRIRQSVNAYCIE